MDSKLSVIIITKNEEKDIRKCLQSVEWANEIIVVDSGSTDKTVSICKEYTEHVYYNEWPGFSAQKNFARSKASCEWVLSLDADEWLTEELAFEIKNVVKENKDYTYNIPRRSYYLGSLIKFGHWGNDKVVRLFKKEKAYFGDEKVHEKLITENKVKVLQNHILHNAFVDHEDVINTMNSYSSLLAEQKHEQGKNSSLLKSIFKSIWAFTNSYFIRLGFLDGRAGFMVAVSFAEGTYYKYMKLLHLNDPKKI